MPTCTAAFEAAEAANDDAAMVDALILIAREYDRQDSHRGVRHALDSASTIATGCSDPELIRLVESVETELYGGAARS